MRHGVHFSLDEASYHRSSALGSSDMKRLAVSPPDFWYNSNLNPQRPEVKRSPAMEYGTAQHIVTLFGLNEFQGRYAPLCLDGRTKEGKAERTRIEADGKIGLSCEDFDRMVTSAKIIRDDDELQDAFSGGHPEVSIFWNTNGVPKKARLDYLKTNAIVDLKTIRNNRSMSFEEACLHAIADYRYYIQACHYSEARRQIRRFLNEGWVYGADRDQKEWLERIADAPFSFVFVFLQAENAPLVQAFSLSEDNPILTAAQECCFLAESNYSEHLLEFGLDKPWLKRHPIREIYIEDLPRWALR